MRNISRPPINDGDGRPTVGNHDPLLEKLIEVHGDVLEDLGHLVLKASDKVRKANGRQ